jgi:hypothetical protein
MQHARGLAEKIRWKFQVVQNVDHHDIRSHSGRKWQILRVGHAVEPSPELDISRDHSR